MTAASSTPTTNTLSVLAFLCYPARLVRELDGSDSLELVLRDTAKVFTDAIRCHWRGDEARQFWQSYQGELRPGRPVHVGLNHLHVREQLLCARITSCTLAPVSASWVKHQQKQGAAPQQPA